MWSFSSNLKFNVILLATSLFLANFAFARAGVYTGVLIGATKMDETLAGNSYTHANTFFVGHFGFAVGGKWKYELDNFDIGFLGELAWNGDSFERKQSGAIDGATYRYESYRLLSGLTSSLKFGIFSLQLEYYPWLQNTATYADDKVENPYRKNDKLTATGFGFGFSFEFGAGFVYSTVYRKFTYKNVDMNGAAVTLPNAQYSALAIDEVFASLAKYF